MYPPEHVTHAYTLSPRDPKIEQLAEDMDRLSDEQFYLRLQELKADHQQTLKLCENTYKAKVGVSLYIVTLTFVAFVSQSKEVE